MADIITDIDGSSIKNGLPKQIFRMSTENKNLLAKAGSLYYGTGKTTEVDIETTDGDKKITTTYQIPITKAVEPPAGGVKSGATYGIQFSTSQGVVVRAQLIDSPPPVFPLVGGRMRWIANISDLGGKWEKQYQDDSGEYNLQTVGFTCGEITYKGIYWFSEDGTSYRLYYMTGAIPDPDDNDVWVADYDSVDYIWNWDPAYQTRPLNFTVQAVSKGFYNYAAQYMVAAEE